MCAKVYAKDYLYLEKRCRSNYSTSTWFNFNFQRSIISSQRHGVYIFCLSQSSTTVATCFGSSAVMSVMSPIYQHYSTYTLWLLYIGAYTVSVMSQTAVLLSIPVLVCVRARILCDVPRVVFTIHTFSSTLFPYVFRPPPPSSFISVSFSWIHTPRAASHSLFWTKWLKLFNVTQMNKRTITMNSANIKTITRIEEKTYWSMDVVAWYGLSLSV